MLITGLADTYLLDAGEAIASKEMETVAELVRNLVNDYARGSIEQKEYDGRHAELLAQSRAIEKRIARIGG